MKNNLSKACFALLMVCVILIGCKKDNEDFGDNTFERTITAKVENGNPGISEIRVSIQGEDIASCKYINGGFTITLPKTLKKCWKVDDVYSEKYYKGVTFSDKNAKVADFFAFDCYDSSGEDMWISINYSKEEPDLLTYVEYVYADRDVTIICSDENSTNWNLILKKGWNMVYMLEPAVGKIKGTTEGEFTGLKWHCYSY